MSAESNLEFRVREISSTERGFMTFIIYQIGLAVLCNRNFLNGNIQETRRVRAASAEGCKEVKNSDMAI